jgi:hypothetical protein
MRRTREEDLLYTFMLKLKRLRFQDIKITMRDMVNVGKSHVGKQGERVVRHI